MPIKSASITISEVTPSKAEQALADAVKGAYAALNQPALYPADIARAKSVLRSVMEDLMGAEMDTEDKNPVLANGARALVKTALNEIEQTAIVIRHKASNDLARAASIPNEDVGTERDMNEYDKGWFAGQIAAAEAFERAIAVKVTNE